MSDNEVNKKVVDETAEDAVTAQAETVADSVSVLDLLKEHSNKQGKSGAGEVPNQYGDAVGNLSNLIIDGLKNPQKHQEKEHSGSPSAPDTQDKPTPHVKEQQEGSGIGDMVNRIMKGEKPLLPSDRIGNLGDIIREMKEAPLSRTEQLLLRNASDAIKTGDVKDIQEMLQTLAENPQSVDRVLRALRDQTKYPNSLSWEKGTDSDGKDFVRLRMTHMNDFSKSSGHTEVTIGSDGRNSATHRDWYNSPDQPISAEQGLRNYQGWKKMEIDRFPPRLPDDWGGGKFNPPVDRLPDYVPNLEKPLPLNDLIERFKKKDR